MTQVTVRWRCPKGCERLAGAIERCTAHDAAFVLEELEVGDPRPLAEALALEDRDELKRELLARRPLIRGPATSPPYDAGPDEAWNEILALRLRWIEVTGTVEWPA